jgi:hypothetical protein
LNSSDVQGYIVEGPMMFDCILAPKRLSSSQASGILEVQIRRNGRHGEEGDLFASGPMEMNHQSRLVPP